MDAPNQPEPNPAMADGGWLSRERALVLVLIVATALAFYVCYRLALPFLPAITWALALAVVAHPLHGLIAARVKNPQRRRRPVRRGRRHPYRHARRFPAPAVGESGVARGGGFEGAG